MTRLAAAALTAGLLTCVRVSATVHCVASVDELTAALAAAQQAQTRTDEVRIRVGHYLAPDGGWHVDVHQAGGIVVSGGWTDAACLAQTPDSSLTQLDGHGAARPLTIDTSFLFSADPPAQIVVSGLTFENGSGDRAGALKISDSGPIYSGTIRVENNVFRGNTGTLYQQDNSAGALLAATDGPDFSGNVFLVVRGNLFAGNQAPDGAAAQLFSNNSIAVVSNTVTDNRSLDDTLPLRFAFETFTLSGIAYTNNVFWANNPAGLPATFDLRAESPFRVDIGADLFNNDLQSVHGSPVTDIGNFSADPDFVDALAGNFHLDAASPLVNAGFDAPGGGLSPTDLDGAVRTSGAHVDIGAYESDVLFRAGFD